MWGGARTPLLSSAPPSAPVRNSPAVLGPPLSLLGQSRLCSSEDSTGCGLLSALGATAEEEVWDTRGSRGQSPTKAIERLRRAAGADFMLS